MDVTVAFLEPQAPRAVRGDRLRAILDEYEERYHRRALVIVDVNSEISPHALKELLLQVKELGYDDMRATFVVVVSASRSALGLTIGMSELRVRGYAAPDFTVDEAHRYLRQHLPVSAEVAGSITDAVGTRAIHLAEVREVCGGADTEEECLRRSALYGEARVKDARFALRGLLAKSRRNDSASEDSRRAFFSQLMTGALALDDDDAATALGFDEPKLLLAALAEYHAFAVDPFDHSVSMQSHFMRVAIHKYLQS